MPGITRASAEAHLAHLAKRREKYAEKKKKERALPARGTQLVLFPAAPARKPTAREQREINRELAHAWIDVRAWRARIHDLFKEK